MHKPRLITAGIAASALLMTSACVTDPNTGQQKASRTAIGAGAGALAGLLLGGLIGGRHGPDYRRWHRRCRRRRDRLPEGQADPRTA